MSKHKPRRRRGQHGSAAPLQFTLTRAEVWQGAKCSEDQLRRWVGMRLVLGANSAGLYAPISIRQALVCKRVFEGGGSQADVAFALLLEACPAPNAQITATALGEYVDRIASMCRMDRMRSPNARSLMRIAQARQVEPLLVRQLGGVPYRFPPTALTAGRILHVDRHKVADTSLDAFRRALATAGERQIGEGYLFAEVVLLDHFRVLYPLSRAALGSDATDREMADIILAGFRFAPDVPLRRAYLPLFMLCKIMAPELPALETAAMLIEAAQAELPAESVVDEVRQHMDSLDRRITSGELTPSSLLDSMLAGPTA